MITKNKILYIIGAIIYISCFAYIISDMLQTIEGRILLFIYSTSVILTALILFLGYKIFKALLVIIEKYSKEWYHVQFSIYHTTFIWFAMHYCKYRLYIFNIDDVIDSNVYHNSSTEVICQYLVLLR